MSLFITTLIILCGLMFAVYAYFVVPADPVRLQHRPTCTVPTGSSGAPARRWTGWTYVR